MTNEEAIKILEYPVKKWSMEWDEREDGLSYYEALDMAISALRQQEHFREVTKKVEPLTMEELSKRNDPVFLPIKDFPNGGYWCLCENGYIIPPSGHGFMAKERPNLVFYSQKPEEDDHDE